MPMYDFLSIYRTWIYPDPITVHICLLNEQKNVSLCGILNLLAQQGVATNLSQSQANWDRSERLRQCDDKSEELQTTRGKWSGRIANVPKSKQPSDAKCR